MTTYMDVIRARHALPTFDELPPAGAVPGDVTQASTGTREATSPGTDHHEAPDATTPSRATSPSNQAGPPLSNCPDCERRTKSGRVCSGDCT